MAVNKSFPPNVNVRKPNGSGSFIPIKAIDLHYPAVRLAYRCALSSDPKYSVIVYEFAVLLAKILHSERHV